MSRLANFVFVQGEKSAKTLGGAGAFSKLHALCSHLLGGHWFSVLYRVDFLAEY